MRMGREEIVPLSEWTRSSVGVKRLSPKCQSINLGRSESRQDFRPMLVELPKLVASFQAINRPQS